MFATQKKNIGIPKKMDRYPLNIYIIRFLSFIIKNGRSALDMCTPKELDKKNKNANAH